MIRVRKFKFKDLSLAFKVRENVWNALVQFDSNDNQVFEADEIRQALMSILGEDELEVQYVVNNVFRYDTDGDKAVTYTQFTNFSVEQHFGQMAIQRLHKQGYYTNGAKRIMNLDEFQATLNYCLNYINAKGTRSQYAQLFGEVDLDRDGFISYQDYFTFLREYFGSQSQAFQEEKRNPRPIPPKSTRDIDGETAQEKFAKLIYTQLKVLIMQKDSNRNLTLQPAQISSILQQILKLSPHQKSHLQSKLTGKNSLSYEQFLRIAVVEYMSQLCLQGKGVQSFGEKEFVDFVGDACHFVRIRPREEILRVCFRDGGHGHAVGVKEFGNIMRKIFQGFKFDNRGLPHSGSYHTSTTTTTTTYR